MKKIILISTALLTFYNPQAFSLEVCERVFMPKTHVGTLKPIATKIAKNNYSKLESSLKKLEDASEKIAFGAKKYTPTVYLTKVHNFYNGVTRSSSKKFTNYFDEISDVFESIKEMPEAKLEKKLKAAMSRYSKSYQKTFGHKLEIPEDSDFHTAVGGSMVKFKKYLEKTLMTDNTINRTDLLKSELMAWYGQELDLFFEPLIKSIQRTIPQQADDGSYKITKAQLAEWKKRDDFVEEAKEAKLQISRGISRFEQFKSNQVETVTKNEFIMSKDNNLSKLTGLELSDYETYTRSLMYDLAKNDGLVRFSGEKFKIGESNAAHKNIGKMYSQINEGYYGVLDVDDYRDILSKNAFPMFEKRHDMRHIHYSTSHPRSVAAIMGATRSQNHLRFVQLAGLYEAIETFQYDFETSIAKYFRKRIQSNTFLPTKRGLDLEESILTLAKSPRAFSYGIGAHHGYKDHWVSSSNSLNGWRPKNVVNDDGSTLISAQTRLLRGVKDGSVKFKKLAKIKKFDGTVQEVPVYLNTLRRYSSVTEVDPNGVSLHEDIDQVVELFQKNYQDYQLMRTKLIERANSKGKAWYDIITEEEEMLMHIYNYQIDPSSPAIRVAVTNTAGSEITDIKIINDQMLRRDGSMWKSDGRSHSGTLHGGELGVGAVE